MTKHKRNIWDELVEIGNQILDRIDEALNPERKQKQPVRVPVPVKSDHTQERDYYNR